jgi:hypothetical protein
MSNDIDEIKEAVKKQTALEAEQFGKPANNDDNRVEFSPADLETALNAQMDGDARLLIELCRDDFCFDAAAGMWFRFNGSHWEEDILNEIMS